MKTDELGKWGEDLATQHLSAAGYAIVERNWRVDHFEVDIVAMKNGRIVFVEVKTRSDKNGDPLEDSQYSPQRQRLCEDVRHTSRNTVRRNHRQRHPGRLQHRAPAGRLRTSD